MTGPNRPATPAERPTFLFAAYMAGGNATQLQNLQDAIAPRPDVASEWIRIEMDAESQQLDRTRPRHRSLLPGTIRNSMVTAARIRELEAAGRTFDAAWFYHHTICGSLWRFRRRVPYVIAMDGTAAWYARHGFWYAQPPFDPKALGSRLKHAFTREVYQHAFHLLPLCSGVRDSLIEDYGIPPERITVMPPGMNLRRFVPPDRRAAARPGQPLSLLFVGADFTRKGGDLLVELAQRPEFADLQFHFVTRSYKGPASGNVHVHAGLAPNSEQMLELFRRADLFVLPTRADSHGIATLEAMAMELPVITTAVGGIVDVVRDGETGFFVPTGDVAALAERVRLLASDAELRLRLGAAGRARVASHFNIETIGSAVVDVLKRAAASRA